MDQFSNAFGFDFGVASTLGPLGGNLGAFGPSLARLGRPRGSKRDPKRDPRGSGEVLGRPVGGPLSSWSDLGGHLAAT